MVADPYDAFLGSADIVTWQASLAELITLVDATADAPSRLRRLGQAITVSGYLGWLSLEAGEPAVQQIADDAFASLRDRLAGEEQPGTDACQAVWGRVLCWEGFPRLGRSLLVEAGEVPDEYTVFGQDRPPVARLALLRERVERLGARGFLPLAYQYAWELVGIGALHEARSVLAAPDVDQSSLVLGLLGMIDEQQGCWEEALARYMRSGWPEHRHRAVMLSVIVPDADADADADAQAAPLEFDGPVQRAARCVGGEMDQAEFARCTAFLNACLWQPVDDWLIDLELGKLAFRRRRHFEADHHLRRSLARAPAEAGFAIADLASTNLSWLSGTSLFEAVSLAPEAVTAGEEALARAGENEGVRTGANAVWLAGETGDTGFVAAPGEDWAHEDQAKALELRGEKALAVEVSLTSFACTGNHRTAGRLIRRLMAARFTQAAGYLVDLVLAEQSQDPLALLETAETVYKVGLHSRVADVHGSDYAAVFFERILDLGRFEFKDLVRACDLAARHGREDHAEELLLLAGSRAEGGSELLELAILRRRLGKDPADVDQEAVALLDRAARQSRDRLERLRIAQEYAFQHQYQRARTTLEEEGVWALETDLSHVELIVALQCVCLTDTERRQLGERAARRLAADLAAGRLGTHPWLYAERLRELWPEADFPLVGQRWSRTSTEDRASEWSSHAGELDAALDDPAADLGPVMESARLAESFGYRLATIAHLREKVDELMLSYGRLTPEIITADPPVSKAYDEGESRRAVQLSELWRACLADSADDRAADRLHAFFEEEKQHVARWEARRRELLAPLRDRIIRASDALRTVAERLIGPEQEREPHPVLTGLYARLKQDVARLLSDLHTDRTELEGDHRV
ncbi:hypothetical protein [Streptomyces sp. NPDC058755]|uniref:hypothetical protein n=1 Tax=Streptomyces sp. NPDC058755 TaxID=3346624 RepID=UPI0036A80BA2